MSKFGDYCAGGHCLLPKHKKTNANKAFNQPK